VEALMSASTIVVALNAQLLRRLDLRPAPSGASRAEGSPVSPDFTTSGAPGR
jgi:P-type Cu2+ transporter